MDGREFSTAPTGHEKLQALENQHLGIIFDSDLSFEPHIRNMEEHVGMHFIILTILPECDRFTLKPMQRH